MYGADQESSCHCERDANGELIARYRITITPLPITGLPNDYAKEMLVGCHQCRRDLVFTLSGMSYMGLDFYSQRLFED